MWTRGLIWIVLTVTAPATLAQKPRLATLAQQKMCADQAKKFFNDSPLKKSPPKPTLVLFPASYVDHYDAKANVCYIAVSTIESADGKIIDYSTAVFDAFENTAYADYNTTSDRIKGGADAKPPLICTVEPRDQPEITCKSELEFNALIKKYFGLIAR